MSRKSSERRMAENQVVFRRHNEKVQKGLDEVNEIARQDGVTPIKFNGDHPLHFCCECSDENCTESIEVSLNDYNKIHEARDTFTIKKGHEVPEIEDVIVTKPGYTVVKKHEVPSQSVTELQPTALDSAS